MNHDEALIDFPKELKVILPVAFFSFSNGILLGDPSLLNFQRLIYVDFTRRRYLPFVL